MRTLIFHLTKRGGLGRLVSLTWLGVYPVLTAIALTLEPFLSPRPLWLQTFIMSGIMVPIMVAGVMPVLRCWF